MSKTSIGIVISAFILVQGGYAYPFEQASHKDLSERAVLSSNLDTFLKTQLNALRGVEDQLLAMNIIDWVRDGSDREDDSGRFFNHFHNPLRTWDQAGLRLPLIGQIGASSVLWGQRPELQPSDGRFTWQDARENLFRALTFQGLTARTQDEREAHLALTFRALGQLIHLVQDAAVPAHTRNDPHPFFEGLEDFVQTAGIGQPVALRFAPSILALPPNPLAPIPIARIIDTTDPEQAAATPTAGTNVGLAEYSNANFLSGDTIFRDFAFPREESLGPPFDDTAPGATRPRRYFPKVADGQAVEHFVAEGTFTERLIRRLAGDRGFMLDRRVYADYASLLLPRAVGYSAGLLDYFFRGRLEIAAPAQFVYGRAAYQEPFSSVDAARNVNAFTQLRFKVRNATPDEETACPSGSPCPAPQLTAVVQYRTPAGGVSLIDSPGTDLSAQLVFAVSQPLAVPLTREFQELTFDFSQSPIPANVADVFLTVVYRGPLGLEPDAVVVGGKDLFEPTPIDVANVTDYFCFNGTLLHVADFTAFPPFNPFIPPDPLNPQPRDPDADGRQDIFGPADEFGSFDKAAPVVLVPGPANFDHRVDQRTFAQFTRVLLLEDQPVFVESRLIQTIVERGITTTPSRGNTLFATLESGNVNRLVVRADGSVVQEFNDAFVYRGLPTLGITIFLPQDVPSFLPCLAASFTVDPALTRIDGILVGP